MLKFHTSFGHDLQPWLGIWDLRGFVWGFADEIWGHQLWTFTGGCGLWAGNQMYGVSLIIFTLRILLCKYLKIMLWLKL